MHSPGGAGPLISRTSNRKAFTEPIGPRQSTAVRRRVFLISEEGASCRITSRLRSCRRSSGSTATEVIRVCLQEGVPIYQGKIDKSLFQAQLQAIGAAPAKH